MKASNVCKTLIAALALAASMTAMADQKDLDLFNALLDAGAVGEQFMSQIHIGLDDVDCLYSAAANDTNCLSTDISANGEKGASLTLTGDAAQILFNRISEAGGVPDSGMGHVGVSANAVRCTQAVPGVMEGTDADRTSCWIQVNDQN